LKRKNQAYPIETISTTLFFPQKHHNASHSLLHENAERCKGTQPKANQKKKNKSVIQNAM
jgi:hypothetical protein